MKQRLLLFDTIVDGHHPEYLIHLIGYYSSRPEVDVIVATGASFQAAFAKRQAAEALIWGENIHFYPIQDQLIHKGKIFLRSLREWNLMLSIAKETDATHAVLMYMDYFPLGAIFGENASIPIVGISFRPPQQIQGAFDLVKHKIWQSMLATGQISKVFSLVHAAVPVINSLASDEYAIALADPVIHLPINAKQIADFRVNQGIPSDKKVYLNFGQLDQRKGIEAFLSACQQLSTSALESMCLLLAGPIEANYESKIDQLLGDLPALQVVKLYDYLHYPTVELCFEVADVVLVTYQGHLGMSSVLIRAALVGKPVIGTCHGTIGATIEAYELGKSIDPANGFEFAQALQGDLPTNPMKQAELVQQNSVEAFTLTIAQGIESLC